MKFIHQCTNRKNIKAVKWNFFTRKIRLVKLLILVYSIEKQQEIVTNNWHIHSLVHQYISSVRKNVTQGIYVVICFTNNT